MALRVSVVICTRGRLTYLVQALASLYAQDLSAECFEVIVVTNGPPEKSVTRFLELELSSRAQLRWVHEPRMGAAFARNAGCRVARGQIFAFLDDDALASPNWLSEITQRFAQSLTPVDCLGGRVELIWEKSRPSWLSDELLPVLSRIDWGNQAGVLRADQYLVSTNMACKRASFFAVGGFDVSLGRRGTSLLSNEDVHFIKKLQSQGFNCRYEPSVRVEHRVPASRLRRRWFLLRYFWQGVSDARLERILEEHRSLHSRMDRVSFNALRLPIKLDPKTGFKDRCFGLREWGYALSCARLTRSRGST